MKTKVNESLRKAAEDVFGPVEEPAIISAPPVAPPPAPAGLVGHPDAPVDMGSGRFTSPQELADWLRQIADKIDASEQPSRQLVAADLRRMLANLQTAAFPGYEDVPGFAEIMRKLSDAINSKSAAGVEAVVEDAIEALTEVKNKKKQKQQKQQLDPKAPYKPLPFKKTGSVDLTYAIDWSSRDDEDGEHDEIVETRLTRSDGKSIVGIAHVDGGKGSMRGTGDWDDLENTTGLPDDVAGALLEQLDRHDVGEGDWNRLSPIIAQLTQESQKSQKAGSIHWGDDGC
jgi:hypothetical protein